MSDAINPEHYKRLPAEAIEIIEAAIDKAPSNQDAYLHGQALKYLLRCWNKNGIEDLRKAKWYLDRLVDSFGESEQQPAWTPRVGDLVKVTMPASSDGECVWLSPEMDKFDGATMRVCSLADLPNYVFADGSDGYAFHFEWLEPAEQPAIKQSLTTEPPEGWRWLKVGEVIRKGDLPCKDGLIYATEPIMLGMALQEHWKPMIRRNKFEVGEKVVHVDDKEPIVYIVEGTRGDGAVVFSHRNINYALNPNNLAPYIEEQS